MAKSAKPRKTPARASGSDPFELNPRKRGPAPEWLPDWRDAKAYSSKSAIDLAWNFLRRNPDYMADWQKYEDLPPHSSEDLEGFDWTTGEFHTVDSAFNDMRFFAPADGAPPAHPHETRTAYIARTGSEPIQIRHWIAEKWGISTYIDKEDGSICLTRTSLARAPFFGDVALKAGPDILIVGFDLREPLDDQIAAVDRHLKALRDHFEKSPFARLQRKQKDDIRIQWTKLTRYLRAYDAAWHGAKDIEIAKLFTSNPKRPFSVRKVQRDIRSAEEYIAGEYRTLLAVI